MRWSPGRSPFQGLSLSVGKDPRALPWADLVRPFGALGLGVIEDLVEQYEAEVKADFATGSR